MEFENFFHKKRKHRSIQIQGNKVIPERHVRPAPIETKLSLRVVNVENSASPLKRVFLKDCSINVNDDLIDLAAENSISINPQTNVLKSLPDLKEKEVDEERRKQVYKQ
jgi:hypothetical protein